MSNLLLVSSKPDTFQSMRVECTKLINEGLSKYYMRIIRHN